LSKIIKASQVTGEYKINRHAKALSFKIDDEKKKKDEIFSEKSEKNKNKKNALSKADEKANKIILDAEKKADDIITDAKNEKEKILAEKEKLFQKIKTEAKTEALKQAENEINETKDQFAEIINNFEQQVSAEKNKLRKDVVDLAVKIASIVINVKLETEHEIINNIIADILNKVDDNHRDIIVRVNPQLIPYVEEKRFYEHINQKNIEFVSDPELKKGDCVVETNLGGKEGSLEHKLDLIKSELLKEVEKHA
jgi:flagellar assembly protein FliH